jgi:FlgD Ig-like domain
MLTDGHGGRDRPNITTNSSEFRVYFLNNRLEVRMRTPASRVFMAFAFLIAFYAAPVFSATPAHFWSLHAGGINVDRTMAVAVVPGSGDIVAAGDYAGTIEFGSGPLSSAGPSDGNIWLAAFTKHGDLKWVKSFGFTSSEHASDVAVDAAGNIYLTGTLSGADFGGGAIFSNGLGDFFVAKFDPNGKHIWSHGYGGTDQEAAYAFAVDGLGHVWVAGSFLGTTQLGGFTGIPSSGMADIFIARYGASDGLWQGNWIGTGADNAYGLCISSDASGNVYVAGVFGTDLTFAGSPTLVSSGPSDLFILKMANSGVPQWSQRRGGITDEAAYRVMADGSGNVVISGAFAGTTNLGGSDLVSANGSEDILLAKYNSAGAHQWSYRFGGNGNDRGTALSVISSGSIFLSGFCEAGTNFGGGVLPNAGGHDIFLAKFGSNGVMAWNRAMGGNQDETANYLAIDANSNAVIGGEYTGFMNLGGEDMPTAGQEDLFLTKFGIAEPAITSIKDVSNDQGRSVRIALSRSALDDGSAASPVTEYRAYRRVLPLPSVAMRGPQAVPSGTWEFAGAVPANNATSYRMIAPTLADSTITLGMYRTKFFVRAATADPRIFFDSPVDSGYSLDNLAPGIPVNFVYHAGTLSWRESSDDDFDYFSVYGSSTNSFGAATLIDYSVAPSLDVSTMIYNYYWVTATDFSGNEGRPAKVSPLTGAGDNPPHYVLSVSAYPNPFNPETTVRYTVPSRGHVRVEIFDVRGERVTTLVDREHPAGSFTAVWRGRNAAGASVSSGAYFARLTTPAGNRTYKLVLLK